MSAKCAQSSGSIITLHHHPPGIRIINSAHYGMHIGGTTDRTLGRYPGKTLLSRSTRDLIAPSTNDSSRIKPPRTRSLQMRQRPADQSKCPRWVENARAVTLLKRCYATWQVEGISASRAGDGASMVSSPASGCGANAVSGCNVACSSARGTGRAAAPRRARQKAVEAHTQASSKITMPYMTASDVPLFEKWRASATQKPRPGPA
jgi:hypothetical protein